MAKDSICNMKVDEPRPNTRPTYQGKPYYFCSADCKKAFDLNPEKYAKENVNFCSGTDSITYFKGKRMCDFPARYWRRPFIWPRLWAGRFSGV